MLAQRQGLGWVSSSFFDQYYSKEPALYNVLSGKTGGLGLDHALTETDVKQAKAVWKGGEADDSAFGYVSEKL